MICRNLTDQVLTVVMGGECIPVEPHGLVTLPDEWWPTLAARGTLLRPCQESEHDEDQRAYLADAMALAAEHVTITPTDDPNVRLVTVPRHPRPPKRKR